MGLVINRPIDNLSFPDLIEQLDIEAPDPGREICVHFGGPVESSRGFVLHSSDYVQESTMVVNEDVALTATVDVLRDIAEGSGPRNCLLVLGYAGWGPGQLDDEIQANAWLHVDADHDLVFGQDVETKWEKAINKIGIDPRLLSGDAGHA